MIKIICERTWAVGVICLLLAVQINCQTFDGLKLSTVIDLPGVKGRIDHMDIDPATQRVFVAALENNTVEVVDLKQGKWMRSLKEFNEPQGLLYHHESNHLFVTEGGGGRCRVLEASSLNVLGTITGLEDADNIRFDSSSHLLYIGYGTGGLAQIDPVSMKITSTLPLSAHPESFRIDRQSNRVFVNVPNQKKIIVFDKVKKQKIAEWHVEGAARNYPMAIDEEHHRLFVGCRNPSRLIVYDTQEGTSRSSYPIGGDADDLFYDAEHQRLYVSCGEGVVNVFSDESSDSLRLIATVPTRKGARTSLFIPELKRYIVAAPHTGAKNAQLLVFIVK